MAREEDSNMAEEGEQDTEQQVIFIFIFCLTISDRLKCPFKFPLGSKMNSPQIYNGSAPKIMRIYLLKLDALALTWSVYIFGGIQTSFCLLNIHTKITSYLSSQKDKLHILHNKIKQRPTFLLFNNLILMFVGCP